MGRGKRNPTVHEQFTEVEHDGTSPKVFRNPRVRCIHCTKEMAKNSTHQGLHLKKCVPYRVFAPDVTDDSLEVGDESRDEMDEGSMDPPGRLSTGASQAARSPDRPRLIARLADHFPLLGVDRVAGTNESTGRDEMTGIKGEARTATQSAQSQNEGYAGGSVLQAVVAGNVNAAQTPQPHQQVLVGGELSMSLQGHLREFSEAVRVREARIRELEEKLLEERERLVHEKKLEEGMRELLKVSEALK